LTAAAHNNDPREVVFYQLTTKFLDNEREIPEKSSEILYYSLQVGHHTGIIDCFSEKLRCSYDTYLEVIEALPADSDARYKLEGIIRHTEIQVDKTHLAVLDKAVKQALTSPTADNATTSVVPHSMRDLNGACPVQQNGVGLPAISPAALSSSPVVPGLTRDLASAQAVPQNLVGLPASSPALSPEAQAWLTSFSALLDLIKAQPSIYLMGRAVLP
jgi:hypothetical protein